MSALAAPSFTDRTPNALFLSAVTMLATMIRKGVRDFPECSAQREAAHLITIQTPTQSLWAVIKLPGHDKLKRLHDSCR